MRIFLFLSVAALTLGMPVKAGNVVTSVKGIWPMRSIPVVICDRSAVQRLGEEICTPQKARPGKVARSSQLADSEADLVRATVARWNRDYRQHVRLVTVSRPRGPSTIVFRAASEPGRCSTQKIGFDPEQRLKYVSIGRDCGKRRSPEGTTIGTVAHEILHAVGVYHEQQRADRSKVLLVRDVARKRHQWTSTCDPQARICRGERAQARKVGPYDLKSVMHYSLGPKKARLTREGRQRLREQRLRPKEVGQRRWLSRSDERSLAELYPALGARS